MSRREQDALERARLEAMNDTLGVSGSVQGRAPQGLGPIRLTASKTRVNEALCGLSRVVVGEEGRLDGYALRGEVLLDDASGEPRLWIRPCVNEAEGEMSAKYDARTYADIAVLDVRELGSGSTIEVRWEEHPKTLRYRRVQYLKAATAVLAGTMCIVVDALPGLVGFLFWIIAIIVADRGRKAERDAFDPIAVVDELLASQSVLPKG